MRRIFMYLSLVLILALIAAGCGGGDDTEGVDIATDETSTTTTEAPVETTTTSTTTTTEPEPLPTGPVFPLTGEPRAEGEGGHAAVVVKISNNDATARAALDGLDEADIIFEERIEVEATRFATVFHSSLPEQVGSVRSGRTSDVQIVANLNTPVFAFSGANDGVHSQLRTAESNGLLIRASADFGDSRFSRISDFSAPDNMVADVSRLVDVAPADAEPPQPIFDYSNNVADIGRRSPGVEADARVPAQYVWSEADGGYLRFQGGEVHQTRDGVHITPANVIILTTTYTPSSVDSSSVDAVTVGEGRVEVYSGGARVAGTWSRAEAGDPYTLTADSGEIIGLAPGQTWVSLSPAVSTTELTDDEADSLR